MQYKYIKLCFWIIPLDMSEHRVLTIVMVGLCPLHYPMISRTQNHTIYHCVKNTLNYHIENIHFTSYVAGSSSEIKARHIP